MERASAARGRRAGICPGLRLKHRHPARIAESPRPAHRCTSVAACRCRRFRREHIRATWSIRRSRDEHRCVYSPSSLHRRRGRHGAEGGGVGGLSPSGARSIPIMPVHTTLALPGLLGWRHPAGLCPLRRSLHRARNSRGSYQHHQTRHRHHPGPGAQSAGYGQRDLYARPLQRRTIYLRHRRRLAAGGDGDHGWRL